MASYRERDRNVDATEEPDEVERRSEPTPRKHTDKTRHRTAVVDESLQRSKYGGFNFGAAFFGWLVATGVAVLLLALLSAVGGGFAILAGSRVASDIKQSAAGLGIASAIAALVVLVIAYYAGGYVAGRMSRFNGSKQGVGVWVIGAVLAVVLAIAGGLIGSNLNAVRQISLPSLPLDGGAVTTGGIIVLVASALLTLLAAVAGGKIGERYHRKVDRAGLTE